MSRFYPVFLDLRGRLAAVVGEGAEAARRLAELVQHGARVRLIAARPGAELRRLLSLTVEHRARLFRPGDLEGVFLAVCEREVPRVEAVWREASKRRIPLNVVDDPARCSFIAPAVVRRGDLAVAISTGGRAPALAVRLKEELEGRLGPEHARFLEIAGSLRVSLARRVPVFAERRRLWYRLVDSAVLALLARGREAEALDLVEEIVGFPVGGQVAGVGLSGPSATGVPEEAEP